MNGKLETVTTETSSELTRRTVVQGAAWAAPVVALAVSTPLAAASACEPTAEQLDWSEDFVKADNFGGAGTITSSTGDPIGYTLSVAYATAVAPVNSTLLTGSTTPGLEVSAELTGVDAPNPGRDGRYSVITTITFDQPISNVSLAVWDIDKAQDGTEFVYREWVFVDNATATLGANLTTDAQGWVTPIQGIWQDVPPNTVSHKADFAIAGPTTTITVRMNRPMNRTTAHPNPYGAIWIGDINFDTVCPTV